MNKNARYEALSMYDKAELNGTELRAVAGNFLYSTGANEFAGCLPKAISICRLWDAQSVLMARLWLRQGKLYDL